MNTPVHGTFIISLSFIISMAVSIIPVPDTVAIIMPSWTLLTLMYWCIALPQKISTGTGWLVGFLFDVLTGNLLGLHALIFATGAYLSHRSYSQIRHFPTWQQAAILFIFLLFAQAASLWPKETNNHFGISILTLVPAITGALSWPILFTVLRLARRRYHVH